MKSPKSFNFKAEWFDVLNEAGADIRRDVIDAAMVYCFTGEVPQFDDDARKIAFGFIRIDIDKRAARALKAEPSPVPEEPIANAEPVTAAEPVLTDIDRKYLRSIFFYWNKRLAQLPNPKFTDLDHVPEYTRPTIQLMKQYDYGKFRQVIDYIAQNDDLNGNNPDRYAADFAWLLNVDNFVHALYDEPQ